MIIKHEFCLTVKLIQQSSTEKLRNSDGEHG